MPERIPQSVAIRVPLRAFLTGTNTPATGKTIAVTISKNGAAYGNPSGGATNATEIGSGSYYVDLSTTDTGTTGPLFVKGTQADIDDVAAIYNVVNAHNAGFDGVPSAVAAAANGLPTFGTGTGQVNPSGGKVPATLAATDVTGNVAADLQTVKTQTVTCAAGVTVNPNVGTTQPVNFTGTGASALAKSDVVDIAGAAVSTTTAQVGANVVKVNGTAVTGNGSSPTWGP